jgi:hypothetical protein
MTPTSSACGEYFLACADMLYAPPIDGGPSGLAFLRAVLACQLGCAFCGLKIIQEKT